MAVYFTWGAIGLLVIALVVGFVIGLSRGLKRSSLHLLFLIAGVVVAFFITKPIANAVLDISIDYEGTVMPLRDIILVMIGESIDLSNLSTASTFLSNLPMAIAGPVLFLVLTILCYFIFDAIYLIIARVSFGKKKKDFETHKPLRAYGGLIGMVEGLLMIFVMFAPITALTQTVGNALVEEPTAQVRMLEESENKMPTLSEFLSTNIPKEVVEVVTAYNDSVVGKLSGIGGFNNVLFDGLASFEVNGEKINFRQEVVNFVEVYNDVAVTVNGISAGNFENIDLTNLKANIEVFLDNGIFKTVVTDTISTFIVKFEEFKSSFNFDELPTLVKDIVNDLHSKFTAEGFDAYEYLKADILKVVEIADGLFKNDLITAFTEAEDKSFEGILNIVSANSEAVREVAQNFVKINIVRDAFSSVGKFGSEKLAEALVNEKDLEIGLNYEIENKEQLVADLLYVVDEVSDLLQKINIFEILSAENPISVLTDVENVKDTLVEAGVVLDELRNLEVLILPEKQDVRENKVYVFDNILNIYNVKLLGDVVYEDANSQTATTLNTYEKFFKFIGEPIELAKEAGLFEIASKGFEATLDSKILPALKDDETKSLLAKILTPFYQLEEASFDTTNETTPNVKSMIFDLFTTTIADNVEILDIDKVKTEAENEATAYLSNKVWFDNLTAIGKTLDLLNNGEITVQEPEGTKTYLQYMLMADADMFNLLKEIINDEDEELFANLLNELFSATAFDTLKTTVFGEIDKKIGEVIGVVPQTVLTNLEETKDQTIQTIKGLLEIITDESVDLSKLDLETAGRILNILKVNAYNDLTDDQTDNGTNDGVFNNIFANLIWYMTSDNLNGADYTGKNPFEATEGDKLYEDVKAYLNVENTEEYYLLDYQSKFAELEEVVDFAETLMTALDGKTLDTNQNIIIYLNSAKGVIDGRISDTSRAETIMVIENTSTFLVNKEQDLLEGETEETRYKVKEGIELVYSEDNELATALKKLMGVNDLPEI